MVKNVQSEFSLILSGKLHLNIVEVKNWKEKKERKREKVTFFIWIKIIPLRQNYLRKSSKLKNT